MKYMAFVKLSWINSHKKKKLVHNNSAFIKMQVKFEWSFQCTWTDELGL